MPRQTPPPRWMRSRSRRFFDSRNYGERRWFALGIENARTPETRARRIEKAVPRLREGRGQR